jgi:hypothetical protein
MKRVAATVLIAVSMSLGGSGTALAQSTSAHPTVKRCPTRACRDNRAAHTTAVGPAGAVARA